MSPPSPCQPRPAVSASKTAPNARLRLTIACSSEKSPLARTGKWESLQQWGEEHQQSRWRREQPYPVVRSECCATLRPKSLGLAWLILSAPADNAASVTSPFDLFEIQLSFEMEVGEMRMILEEERAPQSLEVSPRRWLASNRHHRYLHRATCTFFSKVPRHLRLRQRPPWLAPY